MQDIGKKNLKKMKIKKFNESNSEIIDPKYFNFVFEEFIDNGAIIDYDTDTVS